jgi:hypothetical protein
MQMSDNIYSRFFDESTKSQQLVCQYVECGQPLTKNGKFCNLTCCNREHGRKQSLKAQAKERAKFCNHSCAALYNNSIRTTESRQKQKQSLRKTLNKNLSNLNPKLPIPKELKFKISKANYTKIDWKICPVTGKPYHSKSRRGRRQVSPYAQDLKTIYYRLTRFRFNVYKFPELFDISLLEKHGWYTCPGRKRKNYQKNTSGVSRDHLYSVSSGFANKIHPLLLSHPVNCRLVQHQVNKQKHSGCTLTLDELVAQIMNFDNTVYQWPHHEAIKSIIEESQIFVGNFEELRKLI